MALLPLPALVAARRMPHTARILCAWPLTQACQRVRVGANLARLHQLLVLGFAARICLHARFPDPTLGVLTQEDGEVATYDEKLGVPCTSCEL